MDIDESAETPDLVKGYGVFREEALNLNPDYQPETVTLDGWERLIVLGDPLLGSCNRRSCVNKVWDR